MTTTAANTNGLAPLPRVLARIRGASSGPKLIVVTGLHGNEPSGVGAMRRVLAALEEKRISLHGDLVMVAGNLGALARGVRFIDHDLNRGWTEERLSALRAAQAESLDAEDREQLELATVLEEELASARGPVFLLDLHETSAAGVPFMLCRNAAPERGFAAAFPLTLVLGLLDAIGGTLVSHFGGRCVAMAVEGGQSSGKASARNHEAVIWIGLAASGLVDEVAARSLPEHRHVLEEARHGLPPVLRVHYRHAIASDDLFRMQPGYANIQRVAANELLAHDRAGEIRAPHQGFVLMPLYQAMGDDGFFLGEEVTKPEVAAPPTAVES